MGGYEIPPADEWDKLGRLIQGLQYRLEKQERPSGTQLSETVKTLQELVDGLIEQTEINVSGSGTFGGGLQVAGTSTLIGGITSTGVAGFNVTTLPGGRSAVWIHDSTGVMGQTTSSRRFKTDIELVPYTAKQFLSVMPVVFAYIAQQDIRHNPKNPYFDPDYEVPLEVGLVAEHLMDAGLPLYVLFDDQGLPRNIDYPTFAAHAALVIGGDHETRLQAIESGYGTKATSHSG